MKKLFKILVAVGFLAAPAFAASAIVTDVGGSVEYSRVGAESSGVVSEPLSSLWTLLTKGLYLQENDVVKTGPGGKASLVLDTGSQIDIGPSTKVKIAKLTDTDTLLDMAMGELTNKVQKLKEKKHSFKVKTPASVCAVRGTRFSVIVDNSGKTRVNVFAGVVSAREISGIGEEIYIRQNQFLEILPGVAPGAAADLSFAPAAREVLMTKAEFMNEVRMDMTKEQVQAAAAIEIKNSEYEQGKTMVDYFGKRLRIEEYIVRPQSDQFKFVALNERDNRFDYFTWLATFNTDLPADLSVANQIAGAGTWYSDAEPAYYITKHECAVSNTVDDMTWDKTGVLSGSAGNWSYSSATDASSWKINGTVVSTIASDSGDILNPNVAHDYRTADITVGGVTEAYREDYYYIDDEGNLPTRSDYTSNQYGYNEEFVFSSDHFS
ncbi:MAG: FecR domain-containing protein, partial [Elusimicrobiota bacterium]|nr:FecR domain-containing protein [Elusimicrobiota bacterium]